MADNVICIIFKLKLSE